jgi:DNA-binding cell septation regulator SpoVG
MNLIRIPYVFTALLIVSLASCKKGGEPGSTKVDTKKADSILAAGTGAAAFIYKNNVYSVTDFSKAPQQVTTDGSAAKFIKVSHDHNKYAYQNAAGVIVVVNNKGTVITTLAQYTKVKSFDWSPDDKTLYILNENSMAYYGPAMGLPDITYPDIKSGSITEVLSASVSVKGDFAYVIHGYNKMDGDKYLLVIKPANNGAMIKYEDDDKAYPMDYVSFSTNQQDLLLGYQQLHSGSDSQEKISIFTDLNKFPDFSFGGKGLATVCTPVYKSNINYMVTGYSSMSGSNSFVAPASISLSGDVSKNKVLTDFTMPGNVMYTDWK